LAAIVKVADPALTAEGIAAGLAGLVPPHMIPSHIVLVDSIPFTVGGKIDRRAVDRALAARAAQHDARGGPGYRMPRHALERALARIVADVLGRHRVGADDDFFALGGDSVLATQTVGRIREWLDAPSIMVADIFAARTVAALAVVLAGHEPGGDRLEQVA